MMVTLLLMVTMVVGKEEGPTKNMMVVLMTPGGNDIMTIALVSWGTKSQSPSHVLLNPEQ